MPATPLRLPAPPAAATLRPPPAAGCWQLSGGHRGDKESDRTGGREAVEDWAAFLAAGVTTSDMADHYGGGGVGGAWGGGPRDCESVEDWAAFVAAGITTSDMADHCGGAGLGVGGGFEGAWEGLGVVGGAWEGQRGGWGWGAGRTSAAPHRAAARPRPAAPPPPAPPPPPRGARAPAPEPPPPPRLNRPGPAEVLMGRFLATDPTLRPRVQVGVWVGQGPRRPVPQLQCPSAGASVPPASGAPPLPGAAPTMPTPHPTHPPPPPRLRY
jgi:hypothetical protein